MMTSPPSGRVPQESVQHRCPNMKQHVGADPLPTPCPECYSVLVTTEPLPYQPEVPWAPQVIQVPVADFVQDAIKKTEVNRVARLLMAAWEEAEDKPVNPSYVATFADMAKAVVADQEGRLRVEVKREGGQPARAKVWVNGALYFAGQDYSASLVEMGRNRG